MGIETFPDEGSLEERLKSFEEKNKELMTTLETERGSRVQLEERLKALEESGNPGSNDPGADIQERIKLLASDPDGYISDVVSQALTPLQKEVLSLRAEKKVDRAKAWIAKKEGIDPDEVEDKYGKDLIRIGKEHGLVDLDPEEGIKSAYKIMLQERQEKEAQEAERSNRISGTTTEHTTAPVRTGARRFTRSEIGAMSLDQYDKNFDAIKQAEALGLIIDDVSRKS